MRNRKLAWTCSCTVDDSGDMDIKRSKALGAGVEQAIGSQDVNQGERVMSSDEAIFALEGGGDSAHAGIVIGTFLVLLHIDARVDRHFTREQDVGVCRCRG